MAVNVQTFVGKVVGNPSPKYFESGAVLAEFRIGVRRKYGHKDRGTMDWFQVKLWGRVAETAVNYVKESHWVSIQGALEIESWVDKKTGLPRSKAVIVGETLDLIGEDPQSRGKQAQFE